MAVAQRAEALGYAYLGVADHLIVPVQTGVRYPYTADGIWPGAPTGECFDCIATLAFLAGCTQRIKLLTSVAVVPYRPAVLAAKLFMTADVLSGGRVIAGVGTGWMREEFEALGTPPFAERGAVTDEYLHAWRALWNEARPALDGKYAKFDNVVFAPKPASKPHLPIWVGGESAPALRRTVKFGDAWYPVSNNQSIRAQHAGAPAGGRSTGLHRVAEKAGRDPGIDRCRLSVVRPARVERAAGSRRAAVVQRRVIGHAGGRSRPGEGRRATRDPLSATADDRGDAGGDPALRGRSGTQGMMTTDDWIETAPLDALMARAAAKRDAAHGRLVSYSRKVFIPLTKLCRDVCHYCTFAERPRAGRPAYLSPDAVLTIARAGAAAGCTEALFTLGDKPELRYRAAREALAALGHDTTISYLREMCALVLKETGLLPHVNPGVMTRDEIAVAARGVGQHGHHAGIEQRAAVRTGRRALRLARQGAGGAAGDDAPSPASLRCRSPPAS